MNSHLKILSIELQKEMEILNQLGLELIENVKERPLNNANRNDLRILGSILHDFYTCVEKIFRKIAVDLDNDLPQDASWHVSLLDRMALNLPNIRPSVITNETRMELHEYLRFRHVFRNVYGFNLDKKKIDPLIVNFEGKFSTIKQELQKFISWINELAENIN